LVLNNSNDGCGTKRDHQTRLVLAYVLADHKDAAFIQLKARLEPFGIQQFYTDDWAAYERHLAAPVHTVGVC